MKGKVSIIGGSGFIGENLYQALQSDFEVNNIDKNNSSVFSTTVADVRNFDELQTAVENGCTGREDLQIPHRKILKPLERMVPRRDVS